MEISTQTITDITTTMSQTLDAPVIDMDSQTVEIAMETTDMQTEPELQTVETQTDITGDPPMQDDVATQTIVKLPTRKSLLEDMLLETTQAEIAQAEQPQS